MKSSKYSIRQSASTIAALCLISEFSFGQVNCQNGYDYKNSCNPYKVKFIKVPTTSKNSTEAISTKTTELKTNHRAQSYLDTLLDRYSSNYNGEYGLQAVIDRSGYKTLELDKESNKSSEKKSIATKTAKEDSKKITKKEIIESKESKKAEVAKVNTANRKIEKEKKTTKIAKVTEVKKKIDNNVTKKRVAKSIKKSEEKSKAKKGVAVTKKIQPKVKKVAKLNKKSKNRENYKLYTVEKGDSLIKIAKKFKVSTKKLRSINNLDKNSTVKIGYKIKLPSSVDIKKVEKVAKKRKEIKKSKNTLYYVVKKGDTLSKIAKKTKVSITKLREINRLSRSSSIRVGEKIYLKPTKLAKRKNRSFNIAKNIKFKKTPSLKHKRKIRVVATAYTSHRNQTDNTPFLAAWNNRIRPGMKIIAVSPDLIKKYGLTNGVKVKIMGLPGFYTVRDKMNKRLRNHIDIYMGVNKRRALRWGRRRIVLYW